MGSRQIVLMWLSDSGGMSPLDLPDLEHEVVALDPALTELYTPRQSFQLEICCIFLLVIL